MRLCRAASNLNASGGNCLASANVRISLAASKFLNENQQMLPRFPEIERERQRLNFEYMEQQMNLAEPVLADVARHRQFEGEQASIQRHDGTVGNVDFRPASSQITIERMKVCDFDHAFVQGQLQKIASEIASQIVQGMFQTINEVTAETGNVVDAQGEPISPELLLQALETLHLDFKDGKLVPPTIVLSPKQFENLQAAVSKADKTEFDRRFEMIIEQKRREYRDREASRILVG